MPLSADALPIGVRTASITTACLISSLRSSFAICSLRCSGGCLLRGGRGSRWPRIKFLAGLGHVDEHGARLEPLAQRRVLGRPIDERRGAHRVAPAKDAAAEWREAYAENHAHIDVCRLPGQPPFHRWGPLGGERQ